MRAQYVLFTSRRVLAVSPIVRNVCKFIFAFPEFRKYHPCYMYVMRVTAKRYAACVDFSVTRTINVQIDERYNNHEPDDGYCSDMAAFEEEKSDGSEAVSQQRIDDLIARMDWDPTWNLSDVGFVVRKFHFACAPVLNCQFEVVIENLHGTVTVMIDAQSQPFEKSAFIIKL